MPDDEQGDLFGAKSARDEALGRVAANSGPWRGRALAVIGALPQGWRGTGENLRLLILRSIGPPHHHNVFGELVKEAITRRWLKPTGEMRHMESDKSHARRTPVYRRT